MTVEDLPAFLEFQRDPVQAITQTGRGRSITEDVAKMRSATGAKYFIALHSQTVILDRHNISGNERFVETGPAGAGLEFSIGRKKRCTAADTSENAAAMFAQQNGRAGSLRGFAAQNRVLVGSQLRFPFGVRLYNLRSR